MSCRYIGVSKVLLYVEENEPKPETEALQNYSAKFLRWRSLKDRGAGENESQYIRHKCIEENSKDIAYISFLHTYDYIMPRGARKNKRGWLSKLLGTFEFRFGPGELLLLPLELFVESPDRILLRICGM